MVANGDSKKPPAPSPLRNSKFFQVNMRILVSGGAQFIGSHLVDKLMENENEVIVASNYFTGLKDNLRKWMGHPRFELIRHGIYRNVDIRMCCSESEISGARQCCVHILKYLHGLCCVTTIFTS